MRKLGWESGRGVELGIYGLEGAEVQELGSRVGAASFRVEMTGATGVILGVYLDLNSLIYFWSTTAGRYISRDSRLLVPPQQLSVIRYAGERNLEA